MVSSTPTLAFSTNLVIACDLQPTNPHNHSFQNPTPLPSPRRGIVPTALNRQRSHRRQIQIQRTRVCRRRMQARYGRLVDFFGNARLQFRLERLESQLRQVLQLADDQHRMHLGIGAREDVRVDDLGGHGRRKRCKTCAQQPEEGFEHDRPVAWVLRNFVAEMLLPSQSGGILGDTSKI